MLSPPEMGKRFPRSSNLERVYPKGDALCPRLFTVCLNLIAWKISESEGYGLSKPIGATVTDLLYIDDLKIFAASESKLSSVTSRGGPGGPGSRLMSDGNVKIPTLENG